MAETWRNRPRVLLQLFVQAFQHLLRTLQEVASSCTSRHPAKRLVEETSLEAFGVFQCNWAQDAGLPLVVFVIVGHESGASDLWATPKIRLRLFPNIGFSIVFTIGFTVLFVHFT